MSDNCPVCGQGYEHKRVERRGGTTVIREDFTECRKLRSSSGVYHGDDEYVVYVHGDTNDAK